MNPDLSDIRTGDLKTLCGDPNTLVLHVNGNGCWAIQRYVKDPISGHVYIHTDSRYETKPADTFWARNFTDTHVDTVNAWLYAYHPISRNDPAAPMFTTYL